MSDGLEDKLKGLKCIAEVSSTNKPYTPPTIEETYKDRKGYLLSSQYKLGQ